MVISGQGLGITTTRELNEAILEQFQGEEALLASKQGEIGQLGLIMPLSAVLTTVSVRQKSL